MPSSTGAPSLLQAAPHTGCSSVLLPHEAMAVPHARRALVRDLSTEPVDPAVAAVVDAVAVVVSELLGNAVRHAAPLGEGDLILRWSVGPEAVRVEVVDGGGGALAPRDAKTTATTGRGLRIVEALSCDWGSDTDASGRRTVWAAIATEEQHGAAPEPATPVSAASSVPPVPPADLPRTA